MPTQKPIKVCQENAAEIEALLSNINGRARTHAFTRYSEIASVAEEAEKDLATFGVTKASRSGATYFATSGGYLANAYNNKAIQTAIKLERRSSAWYLIEGHTCDLYPKQNPKRHLAVTQEQADEACKRLLATVTVQKESEEVA